MSIEISIPRPGVTLLALAAAIGWGLYFASGNPQTASVTEVPAIQTSPSYVVEPEITPGSRDGSPVPTIAELSAEKDQNGTGITQAEMRVKWARAEQEFLRKKQDIIRDQLAGLQKERDALEAAVDPAIEEQFRRSVQLLTSLVKDQQKAEQFLRASYRQQWEAEERVMTAAEGVPSKEVGFFWPVEPAIGISAYFLDQEYKERFKVDHYAIDIPTAQGTDVLAAADGIVKDVVDHGLGYNYVTIAHGDIRNGAPHGVAAVYGHLSEFNVRPGQRIHAGDAIGKSGGMPGLPGGGSSTGPHLHFGLYVNGSPVDPLKYLPASES